MLNVILCILRRNYYLPFLFSICFSEIGWRAKLDPKDHPVSEYEFDVIVGADGKRNTLHGKI